jgi:L-ascorbate metabolism protein UlaG (beta-lactamase superfamily)
MRVRWLGWAGVELESAETTVVIDPLSDPGAVFAALGDAAREVALPEVVEPDSQGRAAAGLVSHLHRDHADAGSLGRALADGAAVHTPIAAGGADGENAASAQADAELAAAGLERREAAVWSSRRAGPFTLTALPAVDGLGDPQVSWLVEAEAIRVLHLGDSLFHGHWWRMAQRHGPFDLVLAPINGAVVRFPHLRPPSPLPATLDPEQAALVGELLDARTVVPIHYGGFAFDPWYVPVADAERRFLGAAEGRPYVARVLDPGEALDLREPPV